MRGDRLKILRKRLGLSQVQLAQAIGVDRTMIGKYEKNNNQPSDDILEKMAKTLGATKSYLAGYDEKSPQSQGVKIPVLGSVIAGIPIEAVTEILDYEEISKEMACTGEYFALKIKGQSMEPRIKDGDVVIIRKQEIVDNKDVAIVLVNGNESTIKEVQFKDNGIVLVGWNVLDYPPHFYTAQEVENLPVRIIGKVVELRGKL